MDESYIEKYYKNIEKTADAVRYEMIENFDLMYKILILSSLIAQKPEYITPTFNLMYLDILKTDSDRIAFSLKMIEIVKDKRNNQLKDHPEIAKELFRNFTRYWNNARNNIVQNRKKIQMGQSKELAEVKELLEEVTDKLRRSGKGGGRKAKVLRFKDIFRKSEIGDELKKIFKQFEYTDNNDKWIGHSDKKNVLAIAYYVLKKPEHKFQLIKSEYQKPQLIAFYKEFGLRVSENSKDNADTTYRNISTEPSPRVTHDEFKSIFQPLLKYKA